MKSNELKAPYETPELNETAVSVENGFAHGFAQSRGFEIDPFTDGEQF